MNPQNNNNLDARTLTMLAICVALFLAWQNYVRLKNQELAPPETQDVATNPTQTETSNPNADSAGSPPAPVTGELTPTPPADEPAVAKLTAADLTVTTDVVTYTFSQELGAISSIILKKYDDRVGEGARPIELLSSPLLLHGATSVAPPRNPAYTFSAERNGRTLTFSRDDGSFRISQEFEIPETGYTAKIKVSYKNITDRSVELLAAFRMMESVTYSKQTSFLPGMPMERPTLVWSAAGSSDLEDIEGYCSDPSGPAASASDASVEYLGIDKHYFIAALMPKEKSIGFTMESLGATEDACQIFIGTSLPYGQVKSGETITLVYDAFFGPKQIETLVEVNPALEHTIDFGMFAFIAKPMLSAMEGVHKLTGNYGIDIILLTLMLKFLFYPLVKASSVSMHKMKKLTPQMNVIRDKYKDDRQRQQQEMMKFWQEHKINPMKGCLPILPQIPVFFAFYQMLRCSIELRHAPFFGWIQDLSTLDPFYVTPILMGIAMFIQQKLTPTTGMDKTQEKVMMFMPIMFTAMMLTLPAGMTIYMLVNTVVSIAQQKWLYHKLDKLDEKAVMAEAK